MHSYWVTIHRLAVFFSLSFLFLCISHMQEPCSQGNLCIVSNLNWIHFALDHWWWRDLRIEGCRSSVTEEAMFWYWATCYKLSARELCVYTHGNRHTRIQPLDSVSSLVWRVEKTIYQLTIVMSRLTTGIRPVKCVVRWFPCVHWHKPRYSLPHLVYMVEPPAPGPQACAACHRPEYCRQW